MFKILKLSEIQCIFLLCRRFYKEEDELVLDVGPFAKALEVKNSKLSCIGKQFGKQFDTFMVKGITIIKP